MSRYPDYDKSAPEYVLGLVQLVATYPEDVQDAFADIRKGISARCEFMPSSAAFAKMGDEIEAYRAKWKTSSKPVRQPDTEEYNPVVVPQYFDKYHNRISEREFEERRDKLAAMAKAQAETDQMQAYARYLGSGDLVEGWKIMIDQNISYVPADFVEVKP